MAIQENVSSTSQKGPVYNFGIIIPSNVKQAFEVDEKNGNNLWKDTMTKEIENIQSYRAFKTRVKIIHVWIQKEHCSFGIHGKTRHPT
jgi:hypothetical protein